MIAPAWSIDTETIRTMGAGAAGRAFGYEAVKDSTRRRAHVTDTRSEDRVLQSSDRDRMTSLGRDLGRNYTIAGWMVRRHLDYVASLSFHPLTGDASTDDRLADLWRWWTEQPGNCDTAARHPLWRLIRLWEHRRTIDGDCFIVTQNGGRLWTVEGDRVRSPSTRPDGMPADWRIVQGVAIDPAGVAQAYCVWPRPGDLPPGTLADPTWLDARFVIPHGYYDRIDQIRGVSPLAAAVNTLRDISEAADYALAKAKVSQVLGLKITREDPAGLGTPATEELDENGDPIPKYEVKLGGAPFVLDMEAGDDANLMESATPSTQFADYCEQMIQAALKSLDIPRCFYDESATNYSGARQAWLQYKQSADQKRRDLVMVLDRVARWKVAGWIALGLLELPAGWSALDLRWEWRGTGVPWIDPLNETQAAVVALNAGLGNRTDYLRNLGFDFYDVTDKRAEEDAYLAEKGIVPKDTPILLVPQPSLSPNNGN